MISLKESRVSLNLKWWCEARIDLMLRYSDATWRRLRDAGCSMVYLGAESGSDESLREMSKNLTREQIVEMTCRAKQFDIIPEFSFMFGNPRDPLGDALATIDLIYELKEIDPRCEIIFLSLHPNPAAQGIIRKTSMHRSHTRTTLEEWATPEWIRFAMHYNPKVPWLSSDLLSWLRNCETVVQCRWPTIQDPRLTRVTRTTLRALAGRRYRSRLYHFPVELKLAKRAIALRNPRAESL